MSIVKGKIRLIELFAGIGAQAMSLRDIGADFERYRVIEMDPFCIKAYNAIHGTNFEPTDITQVTGADLGIVDTETYTYLLTYSFPCQSLSVAGKGHGMRKGSGTRSGLLWEVERLLNEVEHLPHILVMENVIQVHSSKNMPDFQMWLDFLESKGYQTKWADLQALDYGVAQSRKRCFAVSILGGGDYEFPKPIPLEKKMLDYLEDNVPEKYYIYTDRAKQLVDQLVYGGKISLKECASERERVCCDLTTNRPGVIETSNCITGKDHSVQAMPKIENGVVSINKLGFIDKGTGNHASNRVYGADGASPTINASFDKEPNKVIECNRLDR